MIIETTVTLDTETLRLHVAPEFWRNTVHHEFRMAEREAYDRAMAVIRAEQLGRA